MLLRHSGLYLIARGLPAIINLAAVALYTRLLGPDEYGRYALIFAGAMLANAVFFQWLRMGLLRFLPACCDRKDVLLSTLAGGFLSLVVLTGIFGGFMALLWPDPRLRGLIAMGIGFFWLSGWFEINLELARSQLAPLRYGLISTAKAVLALGFGGLLAYTGFGAAGILTGQMVGIALPMPWLLKRDWKGIRLRLFDRQVFRQLLLYGLPLTGTFALTFITGSSDRFMLGWLRGADAAGLYAVGNDFATQSLQVLMMAVNLAAFPLAVRTLEQKGVEAARSQMAQNGILLLGVSLPAAAGVALLAPNISNVLFGQAYREVASMLIPWIVLGTFLSGIRMYYFDQSFYLAKTTTLQIWVVLASALTNVAANLLLIPSFGISGAAYSNVIAFATALVLSWLMGRKLFRLPLPWLDIFKITISTIGMVVLLWPLRMSTGPFALAWQAALGATVYIFIILLTNVLQCRGMLAVAWGRRKKTAFFSGK
jgi:O-antigen/teichoic acid export membrane protein